MVLQPEMVWLCWVSTHKLGYFQVLPHLKTQKVDLYSSNKALDYFWITCTCFVFLQRRTDVRCSAVLRRSRQHSCWAADVSWILRDWKDELDALRNAEASPKSYNSAAPTAALKRGRAKALKKKAAWQPAERTASPAACCLHWPRYHQWIYRAFNGAALPNLMMFRQKESKRSEDTIE